MNFSIHLANHSPDADARVCFVGEFSKPSLLRELKDVSLREFSGKKLSHLLMREGKVRKLFVGLGPETGRDADVFRKAAGLAVRQINKLGLTHVSFILGDHAAMAQAMTEGALIGGYEFEVFKSQSAPPVRVSQIDFVVEGRSAGRVSEAVERGRIMGEAVNRVRALGNLPGNVINPETLAEEAVTLARRFRLKSMVFNRKMLEKGGFNGLLAVGDGSKSEPRLIRLDYRGAKNKSAAPLVLVGKAITFDSGGISLKPGEKMDEMKFDKMGGVAVLGAITAIAALKLPVNVTALISSAENLPGSRAYRPGDIITSYDGKTIEVLNTDAEGRIVLADALAYARLELKPAAMVDLATLTGACIIALGEYKAGLFSNHDGFLDQVQKAARQSGEALWHLPLGPEYHEQIKSDVALAKNTGGRYGGAITAAAFLEKWAEKVPWAHLDIAGTAWSTREHPYLGKGATGYGVRLLVGLAEQFADEGVFSKKESPLWEIQQA
ncbi:MAG: leucyl aminopeptidase [Verrucomicrobiae bacterium]|nr:leucyl aminopeptidase [Verrucomicrobiae bacterium]